MTTIKNSTATGLFALGFFISLLCTSLATPGVYYAFIYGGIVISAAMTIFYWRKERKAGSKKPPIGIWIILAVFLLFVILLVILPGLSFE